MAIFTLKNCVNFILIVAVSNLETATLIKKLTPAKLNCGADNYYVIHSTVLQVTILSAIQMLC